VRAARVPVSGRTRVATFIAAVSSHFWKGVTLAWVETNGQAAVLMSRDGVPVALATIDATAQVINQFFWSQIVMGAGSSFMFVPLAAITVDPTPQEEMGYATSLIALARNVGAGIGISAFTAFVARREQFHQARLAAAMAREHNLSITGLSGLQDYLVQHGESAGSAAHQALALIYHQLLQQASVLSYLGGFRVMAVLLLVTVRFVCVMKKPRFKQDRNAA
jgi:MFS transporter, DHA2 family, multidrug resistance protein